MVLSVGTLRFWTHVQSGLGHHPACFVRVASDERMLCRSVKDQANLVTRWLVHECGLGGTLLLIGICFGICYMRKKPASAPQAQAKAVEVTQASKVPGTA